MQISFSSGGLSTEPVLSHTHTHALFIVWRCCKKRESVEVVVKKKHETREKMVSSKNWQTLESFLSSLIHTRTHTKICSGRRECSCCLSLSRRIFIPLEWRVVTCFESCYDSDTLCDLDHWIYYNKTYNQINTFNPNIQELKESTHALTSQAETLLRRQLRFDCVMLILPLQSYTLWKS